MAEFNHQLTLEIQARMEGVEQQLDRLQDKLQSVESEGVGGARAEEIQRAARAVGNERREQERVVRAVRSQSAVMDQLADQSARAERTAAELRDRHSAVYQQLKKQVMALKTVDAVQDTVNEAERRHTARLLQVERVQKKINRLKNAGQQENKQELAQLRQKEKYLKRLSRYERERLKTIRRIGGQRKAQIAGGGGFMGGIRAVGGGISKAFGVISAIAGGVLRAYWILVSIFYGLRNMFELAMKPLQPLIAGLKAVAGAAIKAAKSLMESAKEIEGLHRRLGVFFGRRAGGMMEWIMEEAIGKPFEWTDIGQAVQKALAMGIRDVPFLKAQFMPAAENLAAMFGRSVEDAVLAMTRGGWGRWRRLIRMGFRKPEARRFGYTPTEEAEATPELFRQNLQAIIRMVEQRVGGTTEALANTMGALMEDMKDIWNRIALAFSKSAGYEQARRFLEDVRNLFSQLRAAGRIQQWANALSAIFEPLARFGREALPGLPELIDDLMGMLLDTSAKLSDMISRLQYVDENGNVVRGALAGLMHIRDYVKLFIELVTRTTEFVRVHGNDIKSVLSSVIIAAVKFSVIFAAAMLDVARFITAIGSLFSDSASDLNKALDDIERVGESIVDAVVDPLLEGLKKLRENPLFARAEKEIPAARTGTAQRPLPGGPGKFGAGGDWEAAIDEEKEVVGERWALARKWEAMAGYASQLRGPGGEGGVTEEELRRAERLLKSRKVELSIAKEAETWTKQRIANEEVLIDAQEYRLKIAQDMAAAAKASQQLIDRQVAAHQMYADYIRSGRSPFSIATVEEGKQITDNIQRRITLLQEEMRIRDLQDNLTDKQRLDYEAMVDAKQQELKVAQDITSELSKQTNERNKQETIQDQVIRLQGNMLRELSQQQKAYAPTWGRGATRPPVGAAFPDRWHPLHDYGHDGAGSMLRRIIPLRPIPRGPDRGVSERKTLAQGMAGALGMAQKSYQNLFPQPPQKAAPARKRRRWGTPEELINDPKLIRLINEYIISLILGPIVGPAVGREAEHWPIIGPALKAIREKGARDALRDTQKRRRGPRRMRTGNMNVDVRQHRGGVQVNVTDNQSYARESRNMR